MDKANAKARIEELRALIEKANHDYYDLHQPTVGDRDYDMWEQELLKLEADFPEFADASSPVQNVAGGLLEGFAKVKHDFGDVERKGGNLTVKFDYVNDGSQPLVITRIATSCTCVKASYSRRPLAVGESSVVEITYEPHKKEAGVFHKVVQVYTNSVDGMRLLTISGNSIDKRK